MSKKVTEFLDLADIPMRCIFQYLSMRDRFSLFFDLPPCRIQLILENFISFVNLSNEDNKWIEKYFPEVLLQRKIHGLHLNDKQIHLVSKYFSLGDIQTIYLISTYLNDDLSRNDCVKLCQSLNKLVLFHDVKSQDTRIKKYPIIDQGDIFPNLTNLSINLSTTYYIFNILQRLPNLQILKMYLENSEFYDCTKIDINTIKSCMMLRNVTITGSTDYQYELKRWFAAFGSTIEFLTLNIVIFDDQSFLTQFQHDLLDKMHQLLSFNFRIKWRWWARNVYKKFTIDIQTFENNNWHRFGSVVCTQDARCSDIILYNLPYKFRYYEIMSNNLKFLYNGSKQNPTVFEYVRTISLIHSTHQWSIETFIFIQNSFPNVRTLYFGGKLSEYDDEAMELFKNQLAKLFDDDFLNNTHIQLSTVTTVYLDNEYELLTNAAFQCLFKLLPNLKVIKTDDSKVARQYPEYIGDHYDDTVKNKLDCLKIESINIPQDIRTSMQYIYYLCKC